MSNVSYTDQQLTEALAIPARAWMSPGPGTTRQHAGLKRKKATQIY